MSDTPTEQIRQIEIDIEAAREAIELAQQLEKLHSNRAFKAVILDGYFKDEAIRLVHARANPSLQSPEHQASLVRAMDGVAALRSYFRTIEQQGHGASSAVQAAEDELEELNEQASGEVRGTQAPSTLQNEADEGENDNG